MLDGTCRPICRPTRAQHVYYSGMTSSHCIKFLCITLPNGILCYANGPHAGIRHDARIFREHLKPLLEQDSHYLLNGQPLVLLADSGFPKNPHLLKRTTLPLSHAEQQFNILHSWARIPVEWNFANIVTTWGYIDFSQNLNVLKQPVGIYYIFACLLAICHCCLYGNEISFFRLWTPFVMWLFTYSLAILIYLYTLWFFINSLVSSFLCC